MIFPKEIKVLGLGKGEPWTLDRPRVKIELKLPEDEERGSSKVNRELTFTNEEEVTCPTCQHSFKYTLRKCNWSLRCVKKDRKDYTNQSKPETKTISLIVNKSRSHSLKRPKIREE